MQNTKLKTAVLGLDDAAAKLLLKAASQIDLFDVQAVADKNTKLAEEIAKEYKCASYDDYRQLIIQNQFDCLLVAAGLYSCDEYIRSAMKKKFNILKLAPPARDFEEAAVFVRLAEDENIKFAVANPSRFADTFLTLQQFLKEKLIEDVFLITTVCNCGRREHPSWQADQKLSGGGVLLRNCYEIIDQIVSNFTTPQQVYSLNTNTAGDRQQRLYLTEDTTVVTMKFADTFIGNIIAGRAFGPQQKFLKVYGKDKIITVSDARLTVSDTLGNVSEEFEYDDDRLICMTKALQNFALSILSPDEHKLCSSARENLNNMAVIESAYLSARTGFPEEPARILQLAQIEPTNI